MEITGSQRYIYARNGLAYIHTVFTCGALAKLTNLSVICPVFQDTSKPEERSNDPQILGINARERSFFSTASFQPWY